MGGISVLYRVYVGNRALSFFRRWRLIRSLPIPRTNFKLSPSSIRTHTDSLSRRSEEEEEEEFG